MARIRFQSLNKSDSNSFCWKLRFLPLFKLVNIYFISFNIKAVSSWFANVDTSVYYLDTWYTYMMHSVQISSSKWCPRLAPSLYHGMGISAQKPELQERHQARRSHCSSCDTNIPSAALGRTSEGLLHLKAHQSCTDVSGKENLGPRDKKLTN